VPITVYGNGTQTRSFTFVGDVVNAVAKLAAEPRAIGEVYNLGSDEEVSILALAERVKAMTRSASPIVLIPYDEAYEEGFEDMPRRVPDLRKAGALIQYRPTKKLNEILQLVIDHERAGMAVNK
jgi:UDP-glucose 4-epimerase